MDKKRYGPYSIGLLALIGLLFNPVFGEVSSIQTNNELFYKGEQIEFSGTVEDGSTGLVTIVIRDINNKFIFLTQAIINHDFTFTKSINVEDKFNDEGTYSATGFILNMTKGKSSEFNISFNQNLPIKTQALKEPIQEIIIKEQQIIEKTKEEAKSTRADFVDTDKDPLHYIERYHSEPHYKSWFDQNYPELTIEEAVGYTDGDKKKIEIIEPIQDKTSIIPEAQASSMIEPINNTKENSDIAEVSLAIAGLGILFGAVYGVKRQVDNNSRQISLNKETIKKKLIRPISRTNPMEILQIRLAKGEITLEEFEQLERKLNSQ